MQNAGSSQARSFSERLRIATSKAQQDFQRRVQNLPRHPRIKYITVSTNDKIYGSERFHFNSRYLARLNPFICLKPVWSHFRTWPKSLERCSVMLRGNYGCLGLQRNRSMRCKKLKYQLGAHDFATLISNLNRHASEGFKSNTFSTKWLIIHWKRWTEYWLDLGTNVVFEGFLMWDCISRIHRDILEIWNFNDPNKVSVSSISSSNYSLLKLRFSLETHSVHRWYSLLNPSSWVKTKTKVASNHHRKLSNN